MTERLLRKIVRAIGFAAPRGTGNDIHPGPHLPAEVAVRAFLHVFREVRANRAPFLIDNPKLFKLTHGRADALGGAFGLSPQESPPDSLLDIDSLR